MKRHIRIIHEKPIPLTKRTFLKPEQLERVKDYAGNGQSFKYDHSGHQSLELTRRLAKAKRKAKRYVLFTDQLGRRLYIADREKVDIAKDVAPLTFNKKEALNFFHGFDDPERKKKNYNNPFKWETITL